MSKFSKFFLMLGALAILVSAFATAAPASAAPAATEIYQLHAQITKAKVMSTGPGAVTVRVMGSYTCDKARYNGYVSGKTIYIEVWDVKNKGNDCKNSGKFTRDLSFSNLVPGKYTILVNVNPETGKHQRAIKNVVIPVYPASTPGAGQ
jgi:phosphate-selective porin